ncbi:SDR family NAD(P)-dependent oxidoreductase [Algihabitans albus]|uniref:SDR family NAD(P)-dependent oxidoreductase n=1 Tax=Algihabitans albus TaxID=2164067 RepID=UPI000E5D1CFE|nr:SDR family NAD(P)-dependent oxidoreductase [Algihabitans albus]
MTTTGDASGCIWITGASQGLGRALALELVRRGRTVVASARGLDKLQELVKDAALEHGQGRVVPWALDVTDGPAVAEAVRTIERDVGPIETAVLNAGTHAPVDGWSLKAEDFRKLVEINVMGTVFCLEPMIAAMKARRRGRIAVVASLSGYRGLPSAAAYGLTKAGLINMCESLRPELALAGLTVQVVNPGFVRTPLTDKNDFPMPFLMEPEAAARAFAEGLESDRFEIVFPRRFAYLLKLLRLLPYGLYFALTRRMVKDREPSA